HRRPWGRVVSHLLDRREAALAAAPCRLLLVEKGRARVSAALLEVGRPLMVIRPEAGPALAAVYDPVEALHYRRHQVQRPEGRLVADEAHPRRQGRERRRSPGVLLILDRRA